MSQPVTQTYINPLVTRDCWPAGPWDDEPDKVSWTDEATGLPCLLVRGNPYTGAWCGYVAVEPGHPLHGKHFGDIESDLDVHGGLTFSAGCAEDEPIEGSVCHVPEPGRPGDVWWFGYDCGHAWDVQPGMVGEFQRLGIDMTTSELFPTTYKTVEYARRECEHLADQLAKLT